MSFWKRLFRRDQPQFDWDANATRLRPSHSESSASLPGRSPPRHDATGGSPDSGPSSGRPALIHKKAEAMPRGLPTIQQERISYLATEGPEQTLQLVRSLAMESKAQRVFVVGGLKYLFSDLSSQDFPGFEVLVNRNDSFVWLLRACDYLKNSETPAVLVSKLPRSWEAPTITFQVYDWERRMLFEPYDKAGGTIETASAPQGLTLRATPPHMSVSFCFVHMAAASYYTEILRSQGCPPKIPAACNVLVDLKGEADIDSALIDAVRDARTSADRETRLRQFAVDEEHRCHRLEHGSLRRTFTGGIMFPGAYSTDVLPDGAPTVEALVARKERDTGVPPGSDELVSLVREAEFWWRGQSDRSVSLTTYPQYARIRELGESIHQVGGIAAMQRASLHVRSAWPSFGHTMDHIWKGIGSWRP